MNNKGLLEYKENFITKISMQDNKSNFEETIIIKKNEEEEKLLQLQRSYKDGNILEDDIPNNEKEKLIELYKNQNQEIKNKIEQEQKEIRKLLDNLKIS